MKGNLFALWLGLFICIGIFFQNCSQGSLEVEGQSTEENSEFNIDLGGAQPTCQFNGQPVGEGETVTAFLNSTPEFTNSCLTEQRTCKDGALSGTYTYASCRAGPKACLFAGVTLESGQSITAYNASSTATCQSETRTCMEGRLSGSYRYRSCMPNQCLFDNRTMQANETFKYYLSASDKTCQALTGRCLHGGFLVDGTGQPLNLSQVFGSCSIQKATCSFREQTLTEGQTFSYYDSSDLTCTDRMGYCNSQGQLRVRSTDAILNGPFGDSTSCQSCLSHGGAPQLDGRCFKTICNNQSECKKNLPSIVDGQGATGQGNATQLCKEAGAALGRHFSDMYFNPCNGSFPVTSYISNRWIVVQKPLCGQLYEGPISKVTCDFSQSVNGGGNAPTNCLFGGQVLSFGKTFTYYTNPYNSSCAAETGFCNGDGRLYHFSKLTLLNENAIFPDCTYDYERF